MSQIDQVFEATKDMNVQERAIFYVSMLGYLAPVTDPELWKDAMARGIRQANGPLAKLLTLTRTR